MSDRRFKKEVNLLLEEVDVTDNIEKYTSPISGYSTNRCCLLVETVSIGNPDSLNIDIQISPDAPTDSSVRWFNVQNHDFLPANWTAAECSETAREAFYFDFPASRARVTYKGNGCDSDNYFTISVWLLTYSY